MPNRNQAQQIVRNAQKKEAREGAEEAVGEESAAWPTHTHTQAVSRK